jgi:hypothetical protein
MRSLIILASLLALTATAAAGTTECRTRKSGSATITTCSGHKQPSTECRSYMSGSVRKTSCRS